MVDLTTNTDKNLIPIAIVIAGLIVAGAVIFSGLYKEPGKVVRESGPAAVVEPPAEECPAAVVEPPAEEFTKDAKRDVPDVKLFVMSYCPFGLQMQKAFLPVYDLLKEKADMAVYFVDYIMHEKKEIDENLRQYCIQKEEPVKYSSYLSCFLKDGKAEKCLGQAQIDKQKLEACVARTDKDYKVTAQYNDKRTWLHGQFPMFNVNTDLCRKYGVRGSPTLVVNDQTKQVKRSPEAVKNLICQAFKQKPEECSAVLSEVVAGVGFGEGSGGADGGGCQ